MCHILLVLPFISLIVFWFLPFDQALMLYASIMLVCAVLYWLIWKAIRRPVTTGVEGMIGGIGKVIQTGKGSAKVFYKGEIWDAISREQLPVGQSVEITGLQRMKLIVRKHLRSRSPVAESSS